MNKIFLPAFLLCFFCMPAFGLAAPITVENAKQIALRHANINKNEISHMKIDQEYDDGIMQFEIEFWKNNIEYEYKININTGEILEYSQEHNRTEFTPISPNQDFLTTDEVKQIAVNHAGAKDSEVRFVKISQEFKYGYSSYELKFWHGYIEYKYEIDAANGDILEFSVKNYQ